jgi:hypothetical protein
LRYLIGNVCNINVPHRLEVQCAELIIIIMIVYVNMDDYNIFTVLGFTPTGCVYFKSQKSVK